jgi:hypothetical protein
MTIRILAPLCTVALSLGLAAVAMAAQPQITDRTRDLVSFGPDPAVSSACGFDVEVWNEGRVRTIEYSNGTAQSHHHERYYWRANDKSLTEHVDFTIGFGTDETQTYRGTVFNLQVPGAGPVFHEAGLAVFARDGSIVRLAGLHQVLDGTTNVDALCEYFAA